MKIDGSERVVLSCVPCCIKKQKAYVQKYSHRVHHRLARVLVPYSVIVANHATTALSVNDPRSVCNILHGLPLYRRRHQHRHRRPHCSKKKTVEANTCWRTAIHILSANISEQASTSMVISPCWTQTGLSTREGTPRDSEERLAC